MLILWDVVTSTRYFGVNIMFLFNGMFVLLPPYNSVQGRSQDFSKGGGGSKWVKQYRHVVFATEYCRLFV